MCASAKGLEGHRRTAHVRLFVPADADPVEDEDGANEQGGIVCGMRQALLNGEGLVEPYESKTRPDPGGSEEESNRAR